MAKASYQGQSEPIEFQFGMASLWVYPSRQYAETVFRDGARCAAVPHDTEDYRQRARDLGYGDDTWAMCWQHELGHSLLAAVQQRVVSLTLFAVAHGTIDSLDPALVAEEEAAVLDWQRKLNACRSNAPVADAGKP